MFYPRLIPQLPQSVSYKSPLVQPKPPTPLLTFSELDVPTAVGSLRALPPWCNSLLQVGLKARSSVETHSVDLTSRVNSQCTLQRCSHSLRLFSCVLSQWIHTAEAYAVSLYKVALGGGVCGSAVLDPHELMPLGNRRNPSYVRTHECWRTRGRIQSEKQLEASFTCPQLKFTFNVAVRAGGGQKNNKAWLIHSAAMT